MAECLANADLFDKSESCIDIVAKIGQTNDCTFGRFSGLYIRRESDSYEVAIFHYNKRLGNFSVRMILVPAFSTRRARWLHSCTLACQKALNLWHPCSIYIATDHFKEHYPPLMSRIFGLLHDLILPLKALNLD